MPRPVRHRWTVAPVPTRLGPRLDDFLADRVPLVSRMQLRSSIHAGAVLVDGRPALPGLRLHSGAQVEARLDPEPWSAMTPEAIPIDVVWEDERLVGVVKPAGMLVHPTRGVKSGTLANALSGLWNKPGAPAIRPVFVHRLDKGTSGLLAVAKTREAGADLARSFAAGRVEKRYLAWLTGVLDEDERAIDAPIARISEEQPQWRVSPDGKPARTLLRVLRRTPGRTLVDLAPLTGRTNQLRIHCAAIGHPIVGDIPYGGPPAERLFLHASYLAFPHADGRIVEFESLPDGPSWRL